MIISWVVRLLEGLNRVLEDLDRKVEKRNECIRRRNAIKAQQLRDEITDIQARARAGYWD